MIYDIVIFQCTSNYPASLENLNLNVIDTYRKEFPADIIGFSDHSIGVEASIGAVAKGVKVIEKHLTLNNAMEGPDHKASMNPEDLNRWVNAIRNIEKALGKYLKIPSEYELEVSKVARKSIVSTTILNKGDTITEQKITVKRPGIGIPPTFFYEIIAKKMKVKNTIPKGSIIQWDDLEK